MTTVETQIFLQAMMSLKMCSEEQAFILFSKARENLGKPAVNADAFEDFLTSLQPKLVQFSLNLDKYIDPKSGNVHIALVNMISDKSAQLATNYSLLELEFFKFSLDLIYYSTGFLATKQELATFTSNKPMTKREAELNIESFVDQKCFDKITFGPRTLVELGGYIKDLIGDLPECHLCQGFATVYVERCISCKVDLHLHCKRRLFENTAYKICPGCKVEWDPVGAKKSRRRFRPAREVDGEEVELEAGGCQGQIELQPEACSETQVGNEAMEEDEKDIIPEVSSRKRKSKKL